MTNTVAWLLESICCCGVDVFAIISGFVGYSDVEKERPYRKLLSFWSQVFFYSFVITFLFYVFSPGTVGVGELVKSAMPIATKHYWYASAYFGLILLAPYLNKLLRMQNRKENTLLIVLIVLTFSVFATFSSRFNDPFKLDKGYSLIWLMLLYIIGGWLKKNQIPALLSKRSWGLIILGSVSFTWLWKTMVPSFLDPYWFINYISPTILATAIAFVCLFSKLNLGQHSKKVVAFFSPAAFGVYLIHVHRLILGRIIMDSFRWVAYASAIAFMIQILVCAFGILVACVLIEKLRQFFFRMLKINEGMGRITDWINERIMS